MSRRRPSTPSDEEIREGKQRISDARSRVSASLAALEHQVSSRAGFDSFHDVPDGRAFAGGLARSGVAWAVRASQAMSPEAKQRAVTAAGVVAFVLMAWVGRRMRRHQAARSARALVS